LTVRFGFVGLGRAARLYHLPGLKRVQNAQVIGGVDESREQRSSWTRDTGTPTFVSVAELLDENPDVVVISTPPESHAALAVEALEGGANVFCEKPFTATTEEADSVLAVATSTGGKVAVNHQYRYMPIVRVVRELIAAGDCGRLVFCQAWQLMDLSPWDEPTPWRAAMARRTLLEGGVHLVDLLIQMFDGPPSAVYARHSAGFHNDPESDPVQIVTLEFADGRLGVITIDRVCRAATRYLEVRADCEHASLRASLGGRALARVGFKRAEPLGLSVELGLGGLAWSEVGRRRKVLARGAKDMIPKAAGDLLAEVVDAFRRGEEPPSSAREARDVIAVIEAAYESHATGGRVELRPRLLSMTQAS
jgi:predicted dehydrogenase